MSISKKIAIVQLPLMVFATVVTGVFYRGIRTGAESTSDIFKAETFQGGLWWVTILAWIFILILGVFQIINSDSDHDNSKFGKPAGIFAILTIIPLAGAIATLIGFILNIRVILEKV